MAAVDKHLENPQVLCGTLVDPAILATIDRYRELAGECGRLLRDSAALHYPDFPGARTASPLVLEVTSAARDIYRDEIFGPVSFVIKGADIDECLFDATTNARERGGDYLPCVFCERAVPGPRSERLPRTQALLWPAIWWGCRLILRPPIPTFTSRA